MKFSEQLINDLGSIWEANHQHPFVKELAAGTLPVEKFRFYMIQDYLYLKDYAKLFALGSFKANDLKVEAKFADLLSETLNTEMGLHRQYAKRFKISENELENAEPTPVTLSYTNYMLSVAQSSGLEMVIVALLPCMWSYNQIGLKLVDTPGAKSELYSNWIKMYCSNEYTELTNWTISLLDKLTSDLDKNYLKRLEQIFINTTRYEYLFWTMAYEKQSWPSNIAMKG